MIERERLINLLTQKQDFGTIIIASQMDERVCNSMSTVSSSYRYGCKCKGYSVAKMKGAER